MSVWKMNLKDNRDEKPENLKESKFDFCKKKGILGIGWANHDKNENATTTEKETGYERAKNSFFSLKINDLVWVKNPETNYYYLCRIKSQALLTKKKEYIDNDVSLYRNCEYIDIGTADKLPDGIVKEDLVSISTISQANEQVNKATLMFFDIKKRFNYKLNKIKCFFKKVLQHILKYKWIYLSFIVALTIFITTVCILNNIKSNKIEKFLNGKIYTSYSYYYSFGDSTYSHYAFEDGKMSEEYWNIDSKKANDENYSDGNITDYQYKYRIKASIFSEEAVIEYKNENNAWISVENIKVTSSGKIKEVDEDIDKHRYKFYETTLDEIEIERKENFCEHEWEQKKVLKEASCSEAGEAVEVCLKCALEETKTITVEHNYSGRVCTVCGEEKPKRKSYTVEADTWYTYTPLDILKVQNCEVYSAYGAGSAVAVSYYPICKNCHIISDIIKINAPEINYPISKLYHCDECGQSTIVQLIIDN